MASVSSGQMWLNAAAEPKDDAMGFSCQPFERAPTVNVTTVTNAAGMPKMRVTPGKVKASKITIGFATDVQRQWLEDHQGVPLCFRDPRGDKFYGYYANDLNLTVGFSRGQTAVTLTVTEIGFSEVSA